MLVGEEVLQAGAGFLAALFRSYTREKEAVIILIQKGLQIFADYEILKKCSRQSGESLNGCTCNIFHF